MKLRPMSEAATTGPVVEILVATTDRAGCKGWLIVHYADGGGEDQPRFRGWFYWTGFDFRQIETGKLLGWLPLPTPDGASNLADILRDYRTASVALHKLWSAHVGTPGYDKAPWRDLSNALDALGRDAATAAGHPRTEPLG